MLVATFGVRGFSAIGAVLASTFAIALLLGTSTAHPALAFALALAGTASVVAGIAVTGVCTVGRQVWGASRGPDRNDLPMLMGVTVSTAGALVAWLPLPAGSGWLAPAMMLVTGCAAGTVALVVAWSVWRPGRGPGTLDRRAPW